jgi:hypothetical protein
MFGAKTENPFKRDRRLAIAILISVSFGAILLLAVFTWILPGVALDYVLAAGKNRGVDIRAAETSVGWTGCELKDVAVSISGSKTLSLQASKIAVRANLVTLPFIKSGAISSIEIDKLKGVLGVPDQAFRDWTDRLSSRPERPKTTEESKNSAEIHIKEYFFRIDDPLGQVALMSGQTFDYRPGQLRTEIGSLTIGSSPGNVADLTGVSVGAVGTGRDLRIESLQIQQVKIILAQPAIKETTPEPVTRDKSGKKTTKAKREIKRIKTARSAEEPDAIANKPDGSRDNLDRLRAVFASIKPIKSGRNKTDTDRPDSQKSGLMKKISGLGSDQLNLRLVDGVISDRLPSGDRVAMKGMQATVRSIGGGAFELKVQGQGQPGGALECSMTIWPANLKAEGTLALRSLPLSLVALVLPDVPWFEPEKASVDGELSLKAESMDRVGIKGRASLRNAALSSERIAPSPVRDILIEGNGTGSWFPQLKRLEIDDSEVSINQARMRLKGAAEWTADHYLLDVEVKLRPIPCNDAVGAIPADLLGDLESFSWKGKFGGEIKAAIDSRSLDNAQLSITADDKCVFLKIPPSLDMRRFTLPFVHQVIEPDGTVFEMETGPGTPNWTRFEDISPFLFAAVMAHEDAGFTTHHGFSVRHIRDALVRNLKEGRYVVGASTITMQLVKNIFLKREKTLARKVQEVLLTWWVEGVLEKSYILELYLNVIEYGPGIYGIRNAAKYYFGRTPAELSPAESVYLSTILPNPKRYHSFFERRAVSPRWLELFPAIFRRLGEKGWYSEEAVQYGLAELANFRFYPAGETPPPRQLPAATNVFANMRLLEDTPPPPGFISQYDDDAMLGDAPLPAEPPRARRR